MNGLKLDLEYCYGIGSLREELDLSHGPICIYAPNGTMKTSLAKTLLDYSNDKPPKDHVNKSVKSSRTITDEHNVAVAPKSILAIMPFNNPDVPREKESLLLASEKLRSEYLQIVEDVDDKKQRFLELMAQLAGYGSVNEAETRICSDFKKKDIYDFASFFEDKQLEDHPLSSLSHAILLGEECRKILESPEVKEQLEVYVKRYEELLEKSSILSSQFEPNNATTVEKSLTSNHFFDVNHHVVFQMGDREVEIRSSKEYTMKINEEIGHIFDDPALLKAYNAIEKKFSSQAKREIRSYLVKIRAELLPQLKDLNLLAERLWRAYIHREIDAFIAFKDSYLRSLDRIKQIQELALLEQTRWKQVIAEFNSRFILPFEIEIDNATDVMLRNEVAKRRYAYRTSSERVVVDEDTLAEVLSLGEQRARYLLDMLFHIEVSLSGNNELLLVIDDVADSFDYRNKYAIIEYLVDITQRPNVKAIILTHNFDFFRAICTRLDKKSKYMASRVDGLVKLIPTDLDACPIKRWREGLHKSDNADYFLASVALARNIVEHMRLTSGDKTNDTASKYYELLTSLLHIKPDTHTITVKDLHDVYVEVLGNKQPLQHCCSKLVFDMIFECADQISTMHESVNLEHKIVLSIATRLLAEDLMISRLKQSPPLETKNQTRYLFEELKKVLSSDDKFLKCMKRVVMMTPDSIHLNSFMYEPIIDMSTIELQRLYIDLKNLALDNS